MDKKIIFTDEEKALLKEVAESLSLDLLEQEYIAIMIMENNIDFIYNREFRKLLFKTLREYENELNSVICNKKHEEEK
jgi:hypothetical protein